MHTQYKYNVARHGMAFHKIQLSFLVVKQDKNKDTNENSSNTQMKRAQTSTKWIWSSFVRSAILLLLSEKCISPAPSHYARALSYLFAVYFLIACDHSILFMQLLIKTCIMARCETSYLLLATAVRWIGIESIEAMTIISTTSAAAAATSKIAAKQKATQKKRGVSNACIIMLVILMT